MVLNGRADVKLVRILLAGVALDSSQYKLNANTLILSSLPLGSFEIEIETEIMPQHNSSLEGLYKSGGNYCTQCEAEGFRGITYFMDRPDVMATYTTRIEANRVRYPVLLSNGELIGSGLVPSDPHRHFVQWSDPFPKPCYLFALVAGNLEMVEDTFTTMGGKSVALRIFTQAHHIDKVAFAMASLKRAMRWDEERFGLQYDLSVFNIVAVDDFNMGAMENKSLNIFNSRLLVASPETSTDSQFARVEAVVAHEYFHNWTGNRVTCRDWFQLTLKEGLTVFRDQEFSADLHSRSVKRIEDVTRLRMAQFPEDKGGRLFKNTCVYHPRTCI
jgi:aminopeptidase N